MALNALKELLGIGDGKNSKYGDKVAMEMSGILGRDVESTPVKVILHPWEMYQVRDND